MIFSLFIGLALCFLLLFLWIARGSSSSTETNEDYFLMGRRLGFFGLTMTLLATQLGGGIILGAAEEAYRHGWVVLFYPLGMALGLFFLSMGFGAKLRSLNLTTISEIFEKIYGSRSLRQFAALLSILSLFFILVAQAIAAKKFFYAIGFQSPLLFTLFWLVLIAYTVMGGLKAVIKTDIVQAGFILLVFLIALLFSFGPKEISTVSTGATFETGASWLSWLMMPFLFMLIEQDMGQRCFAAKSPKTVTRASLTAALVLLVASIFPIYFAIAARRFNLPVTAGSSILITAVEALTNPVVTTLFVFAILMAIISTADSILCSISSNLVCDFPWMKERSIGFAKGLTALVGGLALSLAFFFHEVVAMLIFSYELSVTLLFTPILMALIKKRVRKEAAICSIAVGAIALFGLKLAPVLPFPKEFITISLTLAAFTLTEKLLKKGPLTSS